LRFIGSPSVAANGVAVHHAAAGAVHELRADRLEALHHALFLFLAALLVGDPVGTGRSARAPSREADQCDRRCVGGRADVTADAVVFWPVEDVLGGHRAEAPDQIADLSRAPVAEAVLDLHRLVVAAGGAALADREARGHPVLQNR
jgi:hypothetical protein